MEAFLHQRETHPRRLLLFPDPLQLSASNLLGNAGTLLPLLDPLRQDLIDATERQRRGVKEPTDFRNMYWFWETKLHQVNRQYHVCFLHKFEVLGETPEYTVIRCTRHLIHGTRSAGTNHILVPSRVVVHNFGGFYHQSFLPAEAQNIGLYSKEMLQQLHETLEKTLEKKNLGSFFPFGLTSPLQSGMMQRFSLNSNTYHLLQRYLWWYHHQNQSSEHNMLSNSQIYAKQLSWMLLGIVWEEWEASQIHIRQVLSPSQSCCTAKWLTRKKKQSMAAMNVFHLWKDDQSFVFQK